MRKMRAGCILSIMFFSTLFLVTDLRAEVVDEDKVKKEAVSAFTRYCLALELEDYAWAFSLEPRFMQETAGSVENYKKWWSGTPETEEWRRVYCEIKTKEAKVLTPKRAIIVINSPDERLAETFFYIFQEDEKWKVVPLKIIVAYIKKELEKPKDIIRAYYEKNKSLPEDLSELIPEYSEVLATDLFNDKNEPYHYVKEANGNFIIYSFGPDSDDDLGTVEYNYENGPLSSGDVIIRSQ